jgi:hypothetical protein
MPLPSMCTVARPEPALDPAEFLARARAVYGPDGRPPLPESVTWDTFPFEGNLQVKRLDDPPRRPTVGRWFSVCWWPLPGWLWAASAPDPSPILGA